MRRSVKRVFKLFTISGALGVLGGLLTPPRSELKRAVPAPLDAEPEVSKPDLKPGTSLSASPDAPPRRASQKKKTMSPPKAKTAAAVKPKPGSTARISRATKPQPKKPDDQSGGSEK